MRDQDPTLNSLFAAGRCIEHAPRPARQQLRNAVTARLTAAGMISTSTAVTNKALAAEASASAKSLPFALSKGKLAIGFAIAMVGTGATLMIVRAPSRAVSSIPEVQATPNLAAARQHANLQGPDVHVAEPIAPAPVASPATEIPNIQVATSRPSHRLERSSLTEELTMLRGAQSALAAGESTRAIKSLDVYFRRFPSGVLAPEARATQIRAFCQAGLNAQANRQAELFENAHPNSPLAASHVLRCNASSK